MIKNIAGLYKNCPAGAPQSYKLRLVEHFLLQPLGVHFDITITRGYSTQEQQDNLRDSAGNLIPDWRKAKGTSQHVLGEAVDIVTPDFKSAWLWTLDNLNPYQAIIYIAKGVPNEIHLSIPSEITTISKKRLMNVDGSWQFWLGNFPIGV